MEPKRGFFVVVPHLTYFLFNHLPISFLPFFWVQRSVHAWVVIVQSPMSTAQETLIWASSVFSSPAFCLQRDPSRGDNMLLTSPFPVPWLKYSYWCIFVTKNQQFCSISRKSPFPPPSSQVLVLAHSMLETEQRLMVKLQHLGRIGFRCMLSETILHCQVGGRDNLICDPSNVRDHIM